MPETVRYKLRYPTLAEAPNGPLAFANLAADTERSLSSVVTAAQAGLSASPIPRGGWRWEPTYGTGIAFRHGRMVTINGLLERATTTFTPNGQTQYDILNLPWTASTSLTQTGILFTSSGVARWIVNKTDPTRLFFTNVGGTCPALGAIVVDSSNVSVSLTYVTD
jgi:hypothetical protein